MGSPEVVHSQSVHWEVGVDLLRCAKKHIYTENVLHNNINVAADIYVKFRASAR